jgi:hypothetical protein
MSTLELAVRVGTLYKQLVRTLLQKIRVKIRQKIYFNIKHTSEITEKERPSPFFTISKGCYRFFIFLQSFEIKLEGNVKHCPHKRRDGKTD